LDAAFEPWDIYSACVLAAYRSYFDMPECQFWRQDDVSVISLVDGFALFATQKNADFEELVAFLHMQPWSRLQCDAEIAAKLHFPVEWRSALFRFAASKKENASDSVAVADDPGEVYDILARCFPDMKNRNDWMADLALRWRRGTAKSWTIAADGAAVCTASAIALTEQYAYLGAVGTLPEARGRGLAGRLLTHAAEALAVREVWLSCREELRGFYESIGFERTGDRVTLQKESA